MNRKERILSFIDTAGVGLEIGPSHNPLAPKREGFNVHIIDHCNQAELIEKYRSHGVHIEDIEEVDYVWNGASYADLTGRSKFYSWIIASHMIEHTPDMIAFLRDSEEVLRDDGVLALVVPDKRMCFDHFRPITGLAALVDAHNGRHSIHSPGRAAEYFMNVVSLSGRIAWDESFRSQKAKQDYAFVHGAEDARNCMKDILENNTYLDIHAWCFTPSSFRLLIEDLYTLGLISLRETAFNADVCGEFYVALSRHGKGPEISRMDLLNNVNKEITEFVMA